MQIESILGPYLLIDNTNTSYRKTFKILKTVRYELGIILLGDIW